jgi:hypothetical protein
MDLTASHQVLIEGAVSRVTGVTFDQNDSSFPDIIHSPGC